MMSSGSIDSSRISSFLSGINNSPSPRLLSSSTPGPSDLRVPSFPSSLLSSSSSPYYSPDPALLAAAQHYSSANQGSFSMLRANSIILSQTIHSFGSGGSCSSCISIRIRATLLSTINSSSILNLSAVW